MKNVIYKLLVLTVLLNTFASCKKDFLDAKPSSAIVQPRTLDDLQNLLENGDIINRTSALPILASDEYEYPSYEIWQSARTATERNSYSWEADLFGGEIDGGDWNNAYTAIFYVNNVLHGLSNLQPEETDRNRYNLVKGWALFIRAFCYYDLARNFAPVYNQATAANDLGVPLRLNPSIDEVLPRANLATTYQQVLVDLNEAISLLPKERSTEKVNRPARPAAYALAARIYLSMGLYEAAEAYSDSCLNLYGKLIDYNTISKSSNSPFQIANDEVLFPSIVATTYAATTVVSNRYVTISPELLARYKENDLRKSIYFMENNGRIILKRNYMGSGIYPFSGLATDEVYLIKAECAARRGDVAMATQFLNDLLVNRYVTGSFTELKFTSAEEAIQGVLLERRRELVWRALRWDDLRRLNRDGADITLSRRVSDKEYLLPPNDPRYTFPIPDNEIRLSNIEQNKR